MDDLGMTKRFLAAALVACFLAATAKSSSK